MNIFKLPDLGEGLVEVEILEWHAKQGDKIQEDDLLVAVETAKAIVDIPSPQTGRIKQCYGNPGDIVHVGDPLVEFDAGSEGKADTGTIVGKVEVGKGVLQETASRVSGAAASGVRATPAVRALAHRLDVDLPVVTPSGQDGMVTAEDVQRVAKIFAEVGPLQPLHGARRAMARNMAKAHAEVAAVTVSDDADIEAWADTGDITLRLIRAIAAACMAEPSLNAWYDSHSLGRRLLPQVHLGVAVDTEEGLFVPVLRNVGNKTEKVLRRELDALKAKVHSRKIPPEDLRGQTFTLSNFGTIAGRYADPVVMPPTVAILGAGKCRAQVVVGEDGPTVHHIVPLSLSFDHRAVTGGEASRFLARVIEALQAPV
ncbi:MAG: dihydrolipoamide acetyltransferase family protein [Pseudomonadota bacterium]|nr:dihydrolipoamide acetyltransferase family protein [Pseudomonadota bacterium]